jgi:glucan phosphoethanolaminetransferase (alkaline phosphatase superfamily)
MNGPGIKFCGNCGVKLRTARPPDYVEALAALQITASVYVLLTIAFNYLVQAYSLLLTSYSVVGVAGLYVGYRFHRGDRDRWLKMASAITIALGAAATSFLFVYGILYGGRLGGLFGPSWVLFVACAVMLWLSRKSA